MKLNPSLCRRAGRSRQHGYVLVVMLLFLAVMAIGLTAMAPAIAQRIRRDREVEMIHRGRQYARAIRLFYRKFGRYPTRLEELENTNNIRFLRRRYKDPMTPSGEWHLVRYGELQSALGAPQSLLGGPPGASGASGSTGSTASASPFANTFSSAAQGSSFGQSGATSGQGGTSTSAGGTTTTTGQGQSGTAASADSSQSNGPGQPTPVSQLSSPLGGTNPVFGGGPVVGVSSTNKKESIKILNKKNHYNDWQFVYDPTLDMTGGMAAVAGTTGQPTQGLPGVQLAPGTGTGATSPGATSPAATSPGMPGATTPSPQ